MRRWSSRARNGTYAIANNSSNGTGAGAGTLNIGGAISGGAAGATVLSLGGSNTNSNPISGTIGNGSATSLALTKGDAGTWTLTKAPAYTGVTTISGGSLDIVGPIGNVTMPSSSIINNATMRFALTGGGIGILTLANAISGTGAFTIDTDSSNGSRVQLQGTAMSNARTWNIVNKGALWLVGGAGTWGSIMNVNVDLGTGARLSVSGSSAGAIFNIGSLTGNGQVIAENAPAGETLVVGNGDGSSTYSGVMSGVCALTKAGSGTLTLNGPNTYTGATTVHAGTLALGSAGSLSNSPTLVVGDAGSGGAVLDVTAKTGFTIASNQALKGIGTVNVGPGKVVTNNGTLATGNSIGTLNITGGYKFGATSVWLLETDATTSDQIAISEGVTIASGAQIAFSGGTGAASYVLATYSGPLVGSFASTTPPAGYSLDYSIAGQIRLLLTNGGYTAWAATNAGGQAANLDYDHDGVSNGVEYFMGKTGSSFTANPSVAGGKVTWPRDPAALATFKVQVSTDLAIWTDVLPPNPSIDESIPTQVTYTLPIGVPKQFCRLAVMP